MGLLLYKHLSQVIYINEFKHNVLINNNVTGNK